MAGVHSHAIIIWRSKDGRSLPFNHPDAVAERREAIRKWMNSSEIIHKLNAEWDATFDTTNHE